MDIIKELESQKCLILGFGREGKSTYHFLRKMFPAKELTIADSNTNLDCAPFAHDKNLSIVLGSNYLEDINKFNIVIKTPGITLKNFKVNPETKITSQTDIFLQLYGDKTIGITGTKGKSTTTNLVYHVLKQQYSNVLIAGNMGIPLFDIIPQIQHDSIIVCEFSSHQLEFISKGPHIAVLLNLFEEHLDHYISYNHYQKAKLNIAINQTENDFFIYNSGDKTILQQIESNHILSQKISFNTTKESNSSIFLSTPSTIFSPMFPNENIHLMENIPLKGEHNKKNMMVAALIAMIYEIHSKDIESGFKSFTPLPHRLEFVGSKNGIDFYNDSISTIPQATIEALKTLSNTETLILGGYDRGIDYSILIDYLEMHPVKNILFTGKAGERMMNMTKENSKITSNIIFEMDYSSILKNAFEITSKGKICLLSPAASSYDSFKNFEERGDFFKSLIMNYKEI